MKNKNDTLTLKLLEILLEEVCCNSVVKRHKIHEVHGEQEPQKTSTS